MSYLPPHAHALWWYLKQGVTDVVDESRRLVESLKSLAQTLLRDYVDVRERLESLRDNVNRERLVAIAAETDLKVLASHTFTYIDRVNDVFRYGKSVNRLDVIKDGLRSQNFTPLKNLISQLERCIASTEGNYQDLMEECANLKEKCKEAAHRCREKAEEVRSDRNNALAGGGAISTGFLLGGGAAGVKLYHGLGTLNFGIGSLISLGSAAVTLTGAGVITAAITARVVAELHAAASSLDELAEKFMDIHTQVSTVKTKATSVQSKLNALSFNIGDVGNHVRNEETDITTVNESLDLLHKKYEIFHKDVQQQLQLMPA